MRKIKLSIESLRVESFDTAAAERGNGTIFGNAETLEVNTCAAGSPCFSAIDTCPSSPHAATLPCNGCEGVPTDPYAATEPCNGCGGELTELC